jgi:outer membrane receptor protein involved in Fe transport
MTALVTVLALLAASTMAYAQVEQGSITGTVVDKSGAVVPGATVVATNVDTKVSRDTVTNGSGNYALPYLRAGVYDVSAELMGFTGARVERVVVNVGSTVAVNLTLAPAGLSEEVTVTAAITHLESQNAALSNVVTGRQIQQLPIIGRNPYSLVALAPGVQDRGNAGVGPIINGARSNSTEVLLDGAEQRNSTTNDLNYTPPAESIEEFKVVTNGLAAEFGRTGGGVISSATKSGTNQFRGAAYGYFRRDSLNATSWTNKRNNLPKSVQHIDDYGFSLGGPIRKNGTFFFVNVERSQSQSPDDLIMTVPTLRQREGDFSETRNSSGQLITVYDPLTTRASGSGYVRDPFPGNVIPLSRIDAISKQLLKYYPLPTNDGATNNFVRSRTRTSSTLPVVLRVDHAWGRQRLFGAFRQTSSEATSEAVNEAFPDPGTNGQQGTTSNSRVSAVLSDTVLFSSNLIGEFRLSYTRNHSQTTPSTLGFDFSTLGIGADDPGLKAHSAVSMFPRIEVGGGIAPLGMSRAGLIDDTESATEMQGHATWVKGAHTWKGGLTYSRMGFDVFRPEYPSGQYTYGAGYTQGPNPSAASSAAGYGLATFLLGAPSGGQITGDPTFDAWQTYWATYIQDDWKVARTLTLNLGLRYEYQTPWREAADQLTFFDPDALDSLTGRKGVIRLVGQGGASRFQTTPDRNNFAPRLGAAWQIQEDTVVRGAYGMVYYPGSGGIGSAPSDLGGGGYLTSTGVNLGTYPASPNTPPPGGSLRNPFASGYFEPPATQVGAGVTTAFPDLVTSYGHMWNMSVQRRLPWKLIAEAAYVGTRGLHLWSNLSRNAIPSDALAQGAALDALVPNPFFGVIKTGDSLLTQSTTRASQLLKPYPHYTGVTRFRDSKGDSWYQGFTARIDRSSTVLGFAVSYTLSRQEDTVPERFGSRGSSIIDPNDLSKSKAVSEDDRTHVVTGHFIWQLPFGKGRRWANTGWVADVVGQWQVSGLASFATGRPLVITGTTTSNGVSTGLGAYAKLLGDPKLPEGQQTLDRWFNSEKDPAKGAAFAQPDPFTFGTLKRTYPEVRGPKVNRLDIMLSRIQPIKKTNLELRIEAQNIFNTPQFGEPVSAFNSVDFGRITTGGGERRMQIGLRLWF